MMTRAFHLPLFYVFAIQQGDHWSSDVSSIDFLFRCFGYKYLRGGCGGGLRMFSFLDL